MSGGVELTIGMATYRDFDGVYFTLQALRLYQDLPGTELLVIDNYGCQQTERFVRDWVRGGRYVSAKDAVGTAAPRALVFEEARGQAVLCCDCHVLFVPGAVARLKQYYGKNPDSIDLVQGPLLLDDGVGMFTHWEPRWQDGMWGTWAPMDPRGVDPEADPFEIPMQALAVFSCRKAAWVGFNREFHGYGGEEGYLHEKFRRAGGRCLCLPGLRWMHRFPRPDGVPYPVSYEDRFRNYLLGFSELGWDVQPVLEHFRTFMPSESMAAILQDSLQVEWLRPISA